MKVTIKLIIFHILLFLLSITTAKKESEESSGEDREESSEEESEESSEEQNEDEGNYGIKAVIHTYILALHSLSYLLPEFK